MPFGKRTKGRPKLDKTTTKAFLKKMGTKTIIITALPNKQVAIRAPAVAPVVPRLTTGMTSALGPGGGVLGKRALTASPSPPPLGTAPPPRKRERLTHLTPEEKLNRRKLKNRIAAQTARDRKKQKMVGLEQTTTVLEQEMDAIQAENEALRAGFERLQKVRLPPLALPCLGAEWFCP